MQSIRVAGSYDLLESASGYAPTSLKAKQPELPQWSPRPVLVPSRSTRQAPLLVRMNRALRAVLIALCGLAILGYGLDVAASNDVSKLQEQARRLGEQNTELSAQLLRVISFQGIQDSVLGRFGLRVPEQVVIVKEVQPYPLVKFEPQKQHLPLMSGY